MTNDSRSLKGHFGDFFDGNRAIPQRVALSEDHGAYGDVLMLELPDGENVVLWPVDKVRTLPDQSSYDTLTIGLEGGDGARLVVRDPEACALIAAACPRITQTLKPPSKWRAAITVAVLGSGAVYGMFAFLLPALAAFLAAYTTPKAEVAMGKTNFDLTRVFFSSTENPLAFCVEPAGLAAMDKITARIVQEDELPYPVHVAVLDDSANPIPNAYALPGGYITFFDSLVQMSEHPDEIAAVYAHELGHVVLDHSVASQLQRMTTLVLVTLLTGDITGGSGVGAGLITSSYSRTAETDADIFAQERLTEVGLPPSALGDLFARMAEGQPDVTGLLAHLSTHPEMSARIEAATLADTGASVSPSLTPEEWDALRNICSVTSQTAPE